MWPSIKTIDDFLSEDELVTIRKGLAEAASGTVACRPVVETSWSRTTSR